MKTNIIHVILMAGLLGMPDPQMRAQTTVTNGSHVIVALGTTLRTLKDFRVSNGGDLVVNGTLMLEASLVNKNTTEDDLGSGTIIFLESPDQNLSGLDIIQNLLVDNPNGLTINDNTRVNGIFTLQNGLVTLGTVNLLLGPSATITGTPTSANMVVATGSGELRKEFSGPGSFTYPVGDADGTEEYSPVTLTFTGGTFPAGNYAGVNLKNYKYPDDDITDNYLKRYWTLTSSGISGTSCNGTFQYTAADVSGNESILSTCRVNPYPWITYNIANAGAHQLTATGITEYGAFTGVKSTTPPENQQLVNIDIGDGISTCYDATQVVTVAGNGNVFIVEDGGNVTLVAGVKISILPGAKIYPGGYLHGYISTNGIFCGSLLNPLVASQTEDDEILKVSEPVKDQFIKVYPNPTPDNFTVECLKAGISSPVHIDIYDMNGKHIVSKVMAAESKQSFSLCGFPVGLYMIHARSESHSEIAKIVKY
jgi:hypothetical protein